MIEPLEHRIAPANLAFAVSVGTIGNQTVAEIATDPAGNIYVSGTFVGAVDFSPGPIVDIRTADPGHVDAFVAKYTSVGALAWVNVVRYSDGLALAPELAANEIGDVFIASHYGATSGTTVQFFEGDGDTPSQTLSQPGSTLQSYAVKFDTTGRTVWAKSFGNGGGSLAVSDIVAGPGVAVYIGGTIANGSSPGSANIDGITIDSDAGESDLYVIRIDDDAVGTVVWAFDSESVGTLAQIAGPKLATDSAGRVIIAGTFSGQFDFFGPPATTVDGEDYYVARVSTNGQLLPVADFLFTIGAGGPGTNNPGKDKLGLVLNQTGDIVVAGQFTGTSDFDPGAAVSNLTSAGKNDLFLARYNSTGGLVEVDRYGDVNDERFLGLTRVGGGFVLAATFEGSTKLSAPDFDIPLTSVGPDDAMVIVLNGSGTPNGAQRIAMDNEVGGTGLVTDFVRGGNLALAGRADGSITYAGTFRGVFDADPGKPVNNLTSKSGLDFFIAQLLPEGVFPQSPNQPGLARALALGGLGDQVGRQIVTDASGNIYVAGLFKGTVDFDPGAGASKLTSSDVSGNYFIAMYTPGGSLRWAKQVETVLPDADVNLKLALDVSGNAYLVGEYETSARIGSFTLTNADAASRRDIFVAQYNLSGFENFAFSIGGSGGDEFVDAFAVDPLSARLVITGTFASATDFDPDAVGTFVRSPNGAPGTVNGYVLSLSNTGALQWVHQIAGSNGFGDATAVGFLTNGDVVVSGDFGGTVDLDFGNSPVLITAESGGDDIFVAKYNALSGAIASSRGFVSIGTQNSRSIVVSPDNDIYVGGEFDRVFIIDPIPPLIQVGGEADAFILKLDAGLNALSSTSFGGGGGDFIASLNLDANGALYAAGKFSGSVDFNPSPGVARLTSSSSSNIFVARYEAVSLGFLSAFRIESFDPEEGSGTGINLAAGGGFFVDSRGATYFAGGFTGTIDVDVGPGVRNLTSKGGFDAVFAKFNPVNLVDASNSLTFQDSDGDEITLRLTGPGTLVFSLAGGASNFADADAIELNGTSLATKFSFTVKQAGNGDGTTTLGAIRTTSTLQHIGSVSLARNVLLGDGNSDLVPDFLISGASRTLRLGDLNANAYVKLGQDLPYDSPDPKVPDTYNHHPDLVIETVAGDGVVVEVTGDGTPGGVGGGGLGSVMIGSWAQAGFIRTTQSIGDVVVLRDDFRATIQVDPLGVGEMTTAGMGSITVQDGGWGSSGSEVEGTIGTFNVEAFLAGASITAGSIGKVTITDGAFEGSLELTDPVASGTNAFTVATDFTGSVISNAPLKSLKVKGDFKGSLTAPTIGAITAFSFVGTTGVPGEFRNIHTTAGPLGVLKTTVAAIKDYVLDTAGGFGGIVVKLSKLTADTVGLDNVSITAASIGKISVSLAASKTAPGIGLIGIRNSEFITKGTDTRGPLRGSIGAVSVTLTGTTSGGDATGILNTVFDARVDAGEFVGNPASTANLLTSLKVTMKGQDGNSIGLDNATFLGDTIGAAKVVVSRGKGLAATSRAIASASFAADGTIGAMTYDGDATAGQVSNLNVIAGAVIGPLTVKAKSADLGSLDNSAILAGQSLDLSGTTESEIRAALAKANLGAIKISGSLNKSTLAAGASIGAVTVGGGFAKSLILAGAKFGGDFAIDGDETYQRVAGIASVNVSGAIESSSIVAGVNPMNGVFGDGDDVAAAAAGTLEDSSRIGAVTFSAVEPPLAPAVLTNYQFAIQAAVIKSLKTAADTFSDFTLSQFLDVGPVGEDAGDIVVRLL